MRQVKWPSVRVGGDGIRVCRRPNRSIHRSLAPCAFGIAGIRVAICMIHEVHGVVKQREIGGLPKSIRAECLRRCKGAQSACSNFVSFCVERVCRLQPTNNDAIASEFYFRDQCRTMYFWAGDYAHSRCMYRAIKSEQLTLCSFVDSPVVLAGVAVLTPPDHSVISHAKLYDSIMYYRYQRSYASTADIVVIICTNEISHASLVAAAQRHSRSVFYSASHAFFDFGDDVCPLQQTRANHSGCFYCSRH